MLGDTRPFLNLIPAPAMRALSGARLAAPSLPCFPVWEGRPALRVGHEVGSRRR